MARGRGERCLPNALVRALVKDQFPFPCAPEAWAIVHAESKFASLLVWAFASLLSADGRESAIGVKYDKVTFQVADQIKLHFGEFRIVRWEVLDT